MSIWIDSKYVGLVSARLEQFKRKDGNLYNFRCPVCGDSQKNKLKARGYIFEKEGSLIFKCHNCGAGSSLGNFIKSLDPQLYKEYSLETFGEKQGNSVPKLQETAPDITKIVWPKYLKGTSPLKGLKKLSQLPFNHPAKKYCVKRKIPNKFHAKLFYTPKFQQWVNTYIPGKFAEGVKDEPRLIIPFLDYDGTFYGCQGRSFNPKSTLRYITILTDESKPKVFGLHGLDPDKTIYVTEGPIDSMFLPNAVAMAGADISTMPFDKDKVVIVYDNEPRNAEIVKRMNKMIDAGYKICFWPGNIQQKDINDMILSGLQEPDIKLIIDNNTFKGLEARMQMTIWKRV